jgi:hypothetical protein
VIVICGHHSGAQDRAHQNRSRHHLPPCRNAARKIAQDAHLRGSIADRTDRREIARLGITKPLAREISSSRLSVFRYDALGAS